jgi:hypothetical protein
MKFQADMRNQDLWDAFKPGFKKNLLIKEDDVNVATDEGKEHVKLVKKSKKAMMQLILAIDTESLLNKSKLEEHRNKDWPTGKAHAVMTDIKTVYEPNDTMAEMDMEIELGKLKLGLKKNPKDLNDKLAAIE